MNSNARHVRQIQIDDGAVEMVVLQFCQRLLPGADGLHLDVFVRTKSDQFIAPALVLVHHQQAARMAV